MRLLKNTRIGWQAVYVELSSENNDVQAPPPEGGDSLLERDDNRLRIAVELKEPGEILELRYFLPVAERLFRKKKIESAEGRRLVLQLSFSGGKDLVSNMDYRLKRLFANWKTVGYVQIEYNGKPLASEDWNGSSIFPVCAVSGGGAGTTDYHLLKQNFCGDSGERNPFGAYRDVLLRWLGNPEQYLGKQRCGHSAGDKKKLQAEVKEYLDTYLPVMDVLSQIVWLYILRVLVKEKLLYSIKRSAEDVPHVYQDVLSKSRMDAADYAGGMYQAIENACIHSEEGVGWFGFRLHRAGRQVPMGEQLQEARTRDRLYKKYRHCFTSRTAKGTDMDLDHIFQNHNYRFFFEFYVLNNAEPTAGMRECYNRQIFQETLPLVTPFYQAQERQAPASLEEAAANRAEWDDAVRSLQDGVRPRGFIEHIQELFFLKPRERLQFDGHIQDIVIHYGLRLLQRIAGVSGGYLLGFSPSCHGDGAAAVTQLYMNGNIQSGYGAKGIEDKPCYFTEWDAIFPISHDWAAAGGSARKSGSSGADYFESPNAEPPVEIAYMSDAAIFPERPLQDKLTRIYALWDNLRQCLAKDAMWKRIVLLQINSGDLEQIELFSKALFALISEWSSDTKGAPLRIALLMPNMVTIQEFIRFFSIFFYKGRQEDMASVQLALCAKSGVYDETYVVEFMLVGTTLSSALENARLFAYHHAEDTVAHLPMLSYLTKQPGDEDTAEDRLPLFPFDLFLPQSLPAPKGGMELLTCGITEKCWFQGRIERILHTDLREKDYGCMIDHIHIRLGSKLHTNRFFEAELLFHNTGNVARFAYLITHRLLHGRELLEERDVLLLGYEKYSALLMLQIEYWLKESGRVQNVYTAIITQNEESGVISLRPYFDPERIDKSPLNVQTVAVLPVGTTLSTIYKMHSTAQEKLSQVFNLRDSTSRRNFCIVLVNRDLVGEPKSVDAMTQRYWEPQIDWKSKIVHLRPREKDQKNVDVTYLIPADGKWLDPGSCELCLRKGAESLPIIDARRAQTMPGAIFQLYRDQYAPRRFQIKPENTLRVRQLFQNIHYSHLYEGSNHFQFYIDFQRLYQENRREIEGDLQKVWVEPDAFHVVISPLNISNSSFAKSVIDHVFGGCARFFHFNILDSYREEIRSKFSHIAEDYRLLQRDNPKAKLRIHFVDNSIVTGASLTRARLLIRMLLDQSGLGGEVAAMFDHIFLLINRCHFETISSFVRRPETQLYAYLHLKVPPYNTINDQCPACKVQKRYELMGKRSSSQRLSEEFLRLKEKHRKRTYPEYLQWQEESILRRHSYFAWFMQWLYLNVPGTSGPASLRCFAREELEARYDRAGDGLRADELKKAREVKDLVTQFFKETLHGYRWLWAGDPAAPQLEEERQEFLSKYGRVCLADVAQSVEETHPGARKAFERKVIALVQTHLIHVRGYMRLAAMQAAYEALEQADLRASALDCGSCRAVMVNLISGKLLTRRGLEGTSPEEVRFTLAHDLEWLISYIKVLSREQVVNYYDYRQAIVGVMDNIFDIMEEASGQSSRHVIDDLTHERGGADWKPIIDVLTWLCQDTSQVTSQISAQYQYQLHMTLMHRISDLQIVSRVSPYNVNRTVELYERLIDRYFSCPDPSFFVEMPTTDSLILRYLKALKVATMLSDDVTPCLKLTQTAKTLNEDYCRQDRPERERKKLLRCAQYIYLENTQMMYTGMRTLERLICSGACGALEQHRPAEDFKLYIQSLSRKVEDHLSRCYKNLDKEAKEDDLMWQNVLNNFCRFWHGSTGHAPLSGGKGSHLEKTTYMLQYFMRLDSMSDEPGQEERNELPYLYEELCRCICGFTGVKMCYIACSNNGEAPDIFTQSGYHSELLLEGNILTPEKMEPLLRKARQANDKPEQPSPDGEQEKAFDLLLPNVVIGSEKELDYLILSIPAQGSQTEGHMFSIVLQGRKDGRWDAHTALQAARDILFMRQKLQARLSRDYSVLISTRFDCSYIRRIAPAARGPAALHLSDLHIREELSGEWLERKVRETIKGTLERKGNPVVDLLIVSGDVVDNRRANAFQMEENYRLAEKLLLHVADSLWKDDDGYLPHDWRRRVIICTGNHDFASMNQYEATQRRRTLTAAMPAEGEGGTIAKFAYFMDFLVRFLDVPTDELLRNDLNEVRHYRNLGIKVLTLNCSGAASIQRTNKIGLTQEKLMPLLQREVWASGYGECREAFRRKSKDFRVCVAHYSPEYKLSYLLDKYQALPGWEWDPRNAETASMNRLVSLFGLTMQLTHRAYTNLKLENRENPVPEELARTLEQRQKELQQSLEHLNLALDALEHDADKDTLRPSEAIQFYNCLEGKQDAVEKIRENELYRQIKYYCECIRGSDPNAIFRNERLIKLAGEVAESVIMSELDKEKFHRTLTDINKKTCIDLYLAGHIHAYAASGGTVDADGGDKKEEADAPAAPMQILVADQLYDPGRAGVHGYLILNMGTPEFTYHKLDEYSPGPPPEKKV